jgi:hypothetical protein
VVVTPTDRQLDIESRGNVPAPDLLPIGTFVEHRWRVDLSPPAEIEPDGPPITEFLPSVRVGWGVALDATASRLVDLVGDPTPIDPRLRALEQQIVAGTSPGASDERARRLYRWVLDHVQDGKETDGRRVLTGRSGARQAAFRYLLRMAGIDCELALVKSRLAMPPLGPMSEIEQYEALVMRLTTDRGLRWMTVRDKFAPFGYVPAEWRDQTAIRLVAGTPRDVVRAPAAADRVAYEGRADVHDDGSAVLDLTLTFDGNRAIAWRTALDQVPQSKINEFVEREVIAPSFDGAHVNDLKALGASDLDKPLVLHVRVDVPELAKRVPGGLAVHPPFAPPLAQLAALPARRTALLRRTSWRAEIRVRVVMPESTTLPPGLPHAARRRRVRGRQRYGPRTRHRVRSGHRHAFRPSPTGRRIHAMADLRAERRRSRDARRSGGQVSGRVGAYRVLDRPRQALLNSAIVSIVRGFHTILRMTWGVTVGT